MKHFKACLLAGAALAGLAGLPGAARAEVKTYSNSPGLSAGSSHA